MRIGVVEVVAALIKDLADTEDTADAGDADGNANSANNAGDKKQINGLYDLLLERALDVSSYVRVKVLAALTRLCDIRSSKFPKQRLAVTRAAVGALEDKAAMVRKSAAALLVRLLLTHPYGVVHGGMLTLEVWEEEYRALKAELGRLEAAVGDGSGQADVDEDAEKPDEDDAPKKNKKSKKKWAFVFIDIFHN
jgi:condensin complex subunit 1